MGGVSSSLLALVLLASPPQSPSTAGEARQTASAGRPASDLTAATSSDSRAADADRLRSVHKYREATGAYRALIQSDPTGPRSPRYQDAIVACFDALNDREAVFAERRRLIATYRPGSAWTTANAGNASALAEARELTEAATRILATKLHQEAQKRKKRHEGKPEDFAQVRDLYKEYLDRYSDSKFAYNIRFYYAEALWELAEYDVAALQYRRTVDADPKGQYSKMAAYDEILCYEKLTEIEKSKPLTREEIEEHTRCHQSSAHCREKPKSIPDCEIGMVRAIDRYISLYPGVDDEITVRYKAAFVFYDHEHFAEAARRFREVVEKWPEDRFARNSADLVLDMLNKTEQWSELRSTAQAFLQNQRLMGAHRDLNSRFREMIEGSEFKLFETAVKRDCASPRESAERYAEYAGKFPESRYAGEAVFKAMKGLVESGDTQRAIDLAERLAPGGYGGWDARRYLEQLKGVSSPPPIAQPDAIVSDDDAADDSRDDAESEQPEE